MLSNFRLLFSPRIFVVYFEHIFERKNGRIIFVNLFSYNDNVSTHTYLYILLL